MKQDDPTRADRRDACLSRRYIGPPGGQLHLTEATPPASSAPRLICLHATAYSGASFQPLLQVLGVRRRVVAADTPGYGGSDRPCRPWSIPQYAEAFGVALDEDDPEPFDLLGYHTGALIAVELARSRPDLVRRLVLIGVPYFLGDARRCMRERLAAQQVLTEGLDQFEERWRFLVTERAAQVSLERGLLNFTDELRAYPFGWWAHDAAFTFDIEHSMANLPQETLVINPHNHLADASRRACALIPNARIKEMPELEHSIFDAAPDMLSDIIDGFLTR